MGAAEQYRERELTFDVDEQWVAPTLTSLVPGGSIDVETVHLSSTYVDTADRRLLRSRLTLRRRTGDADNGWHLKVPDGDARLELRWPVGRANVPAQIDDVTAGIRGRAALRPVAVLDLHREVHRVTDRDGAVLVELAVDRVSATRIGASAPDTWREVEIELVDGGAAALSAAAGLLLASGARPAANSSKIARALGHAPVIRHRPRSLAALLAGYLDQQWMVIVRGDVGLRTGEDRVHRTRVAIRRYRSALRAFASVLDTDETAELDAALTGLAGVLGRLRDAQVLDEQLPTALDDGGHATLSPLTRRLLADALVEESKQARAAVDAHLRSPAHASLLTRLRDWHEHLPMTDDAPEQDVTEIERQARRKARRRLGQVRVLPPGVDADLAAHRARKAAKRARYVADLARPVLGKQARTHANKQKKVQERLGARQDRVIAAAFVRRVAEGADGPVGFELGVLHEHLLRGAGPGAR